MKKLLNLILILLGSAQGFCQTTEHVFLITTDGLRWQEVFAGADSALLFDPNVTEDVQKTAKKYWAPTPAERRRLLLPFMTDVVATQGQLHGNRWLGSHVDIKNPYGFSYPGYNEILTGVADPAVNSNNKVYNANVTVLEHLNRLPEFKGKVAAFGTWDVFPYIINAPRSGVPVNAGVQAVAEPSPKQELLNEIQRLYPSLASDRHDFVTYFLAKEYIKRQQPKVVFIAFDETDEFAHENKYREYLTAAHTFDAFVKDLWEYCQQHPTYAGKTTFILTTDHGRGDADKRQWTSHGQKVPDCGSIWLGALGKGVKAAAPKPSTQLYQNQVAQTLASLLGYPMLTPGAGNAILLNR